MSRNFSSSFDKVRKWYIVVVIVIFSITGYMLIINENPESEKNLDTADLIQKISKCLDAKYDDWSGNYSLGYEEIIFARFENMDIKEISNLVFFSNINASRIYSFSDGSVYVDFGMRENLPSSKICNFLNHENITYHGIYHLGILL